MHGESTVKLFCGHVVPDKEYAKMFREKRVRCPIDGTEWRGSMVIANVKSLPKKELRQAAQQQAERDKQRGKR